MRVKGVTLAASNFEKSRSFYEGLELLCVVAFRRDKSWPGR